jgi:hypothetical protein
MPPDAMLPDYDPPEVSRCADASGPGAPGDDTYLGRLGRFAQVRCAPLAAGLAPAVARAWTHDTQASSAAQARHVFLGCSCAHATPCGGGARPHARAHTRSQEHGMTRLNELYEDDRDHRGD